MAKKLDQIMAALPARHRGKIEARTAELATLKDLSQVVAQTQEELAATLGVGQDTISRLEKRSACCCRRYVEAMGGKLELVAKFPDRPPLVVDHLANETSARRAVSAQVKAHA